MPQRNQRPRPRIVTKNIRLADFILRDMEPIFAEWESFAATHIQAAASMDGFALRDHAPDILRAIALDLHTDQSAREQDQKAKGDAPPTRGASNTAAHAHAVLRAQSGFSIVQLTAEYRALRASVLRLWAAACEESPSGYSLAMQDVQRFNEAIDQSLMESVTFFTQEVERTRNLFLAVICHDLRNPLMAILASNQSLMKLGLDGRAAEAIERVRRGGAQVKQLLDDLVDYNRAALGTVIPIAVTEIDLTEVCAREIDSLESHHSDRIIRFQATGNLRGFWDPGRIQQLLSNLVKNALDYGARNEAILVRATGTEREVVLSVHNQGTAIPAATLHNIFEPMTRGASEQERRHSDTNMGLGLFIAREIAQAHHGSIEVISDERETVFTVRLPRDRRQGRGIKREDAPLGLRSISAER